MPKQIVNTTQAWSDNTSPLNQVNAVRLQAISDGATLLNGAVIDQLDVSTRVGNAFPLGADTLLMGDSTQADAGAPLKVSLANLLLEAQRNGTQRWGGTAGGTANAIVLTTSPASVTVGYVAGEIIRFITSAANTGAVTINLDTRGAASLYSPAGTPLVAGDLPAGCIVDAIYDGAHFQITGRAAVNTHELAQQARGDCQQYAVATGTNSLTMAPVDSNGSPTFVGVIPTGAVVRFKNTTANTGACTISVNGISGGNLLYNGVAISAGRLAAGAFVTAVFDGTNFQTTAFTLGWDYIALAGSTLAGGQVSFTHGLGQVPPKVRCVVSLTGTQSPWVAGAEIPVEMLNGPGAAYNASWWADATKIYVNFSSGTLNCVTGSGTNTNLTITQWTVKVYASL